MRADKSLGVAGMCNTKKSGLLASLICRHSLVAERAKEGPLASAGSIPADDTIAEWRSGHLTGFIHRRHGFKSHLRYIQGQERGGLRIHSEDEGSIPSLSNKT